MSKQTLAASLLAAALISASVSIAHATAVFEAPRKFQKPGSKLELDLGPQAATFIGFGHAAYRKSHTDAEAFQQSVLAFLEAPSQESLETARQAWRNARPAYQRTEMLRFFNGPIDHPGDAQIEPGPEPRINAWPLNEAAIDGVEGWPDAGLVNDFERPLDLELIVGANQTADEADVTTGWHAIEFLLWGQDLSADGPGDRPFEDFLPGSPATERRRTYLRLVTEQLVADLASVALQWDAEREDTYAHWLRSQPAVEVLGRGLHGAASLASIEIHGERLTVALDSGSQEDEHSCFSDNSLRDLQGNLEGIRWFVEGRYEDQRLGPSLLELLEWRDPAHATRLRDAIARAERDMAEVPEPLDQILVSEDGSESRASAEKAAASARQLAVALKAAAETLAIDIVVPGV
jgi:putative iron-regulated protein